MSLSSSDASNATSRLRLGLERKKLSAKIAKLNAVQSVEHRHTLVEAAMKKKTRRSLNTSSESKTSKGVLAAKLLWRKTGVASTLPASVDLNFAMIVEISGMLAIALLNVDNKKEEYIYHSGSDKSHKHEIDSSFEACFDHLVLLM